MQKQRGKHSSWTVCMQQSAVNSPQRWAQRVPLLLAWRHLRVMSLLFFWGGVWLLFYWFIWSTTLSIIETVCMFTRGCRLSRVDRETHAFDLNLPLSRHTRPLSRSLFAFASSRSSSDGPRRRTRRGGVFTDCQ